MSLARVTWIGGPVLLARMEGPFSVHEALAIGPAASIGVRKMTGAERHFSPRACIRRTISTASSPAIGKSMITASIPRPASSAMSMMAKASSPLAQA